jgi:hypothetical protein
MCKLRKKYSSVHKNTHQYTVILYSYISHCIERQNQLDINRAYVRSNTHTNVD